MPTRTGCPGGPAAAIEISGTTRTIEPISRARRRFIAMARIRLADRGGDGGADDIEPIRVPDEMRRQDVDVVLVGLDVGIILRDRGEALVPIGHRVNDAVRLRG